MINEAANDSDVGLNGEGALDELGETLEGFHYSFDSGTSK